jgi:uncharacterized membrane protein YedE/YeeE
MTEESEFLPLQSVLGGLFIGAACGAYMFFAQRIAGCSGALKAAVDGPREAPKLSFLGGLLLSGTVMGTALPSAFEVPPAPGAALVVGGLVAGVGSALGNGCTSGHGLCGMSRMSLRSLVAVPVFMGCAVLASTVRGGVYEIGAMAPMGETPDVVVSLAARAALALGAALLPLFLAKRQSSTTEAYAGLWSGVCFGVGLSIGGMVRPSVVFAALSPGRFDPTLWTLFMTALGTTFVLFRLAERVGDVEEATCTVQGVVDARLVTGAALFGIGWGLGGFCPGPLIVSVGAIPTATGLLVPLAAMAIGQKLVGVLAK